MTWRYPIETPSPENPLSFGTPDDVIEVGATVGLRSGPSRRDGISRPDVEVNRYPDRGQETSNVGVVIAHVNDAGVGSASDQPNDNLPKGSYNRDQCPLACPAARRTSAKTTASFALTTSPLCCNSHDYLV